MTNPVVEAFTIVTADGPPHGAVRHRPIEDGTDGIHAGITPEGTRVLIVEVADDAPRRDDTSSRGVWLLAAPALGDMRVHVLECRDPSLDGVFTQLAVELVDDLRDAELGDRWRLLRRRLDEWRKLFSPGAQDGTMSRDAQIGLWGELAVLRRRTAAGAADALDSWEAGLGSAGPDFRWPGIALEVKTTTALEGFDLRIHGLAQLEPPPSGATVRIAGVRAVLEPDGTSIPGLVNELLEVLDRGELLRRLDVRGYHHDPARDNDWLHFTLDAISVWEVGEDTPRLSPSRLPPEWRAAITEVEYTLDAAALGEPLADEDALWL